jgi:hypothetical protein
MNGRLQHGGARRNRARLSAWLLAAAAAGIYVAVILWHVSGSAA